MQHDISLEEILSEEFSQKGASDISEQYTYNAIHIPAPNWSFIQKALTENEGNKSKAAKSLNISRGSLYYQIKKHEFREWISGEKTIRPIEVWTYRTRTLRR